MSASIHNIIQSAVKITSMTDAQRVEALLKLLESNPSVVIKSLGLSASTKLYKVVAKIYKGAGKIPLIKAFRVIHGCGLAEAKHWSEGQPYNSLQSGVFKEGISLDEAKNLAARIRQDLSNPAHIYIEVIPNDIRTDPLPYNWDNLPADPNVDPMMCPHGT
jgi:ribosomal protein L7/L12